VCIIRWSDTCTAAQFSIPVYLQAAAPRVQHHYAHVCMHFSRSRAIGLENVFARRTQTRDKFIQTRLCASVLVYNGFKSAANIYSTCKDTTRKKLTAGECASSAGRAQARAGYPIIATSFASYICIISLYLYLHV
jgi:hypothetical protein